MSIKRKLPKGWKHPTVRKVVEADPKVAIPPEWTKDTLVPFLPMSLIDEATATIRAIDLKPFHQCRSGKSRFANGDVLFAKITPCVENGKMALVSGLNVSVGFGSTEFFVLRAHDEVLPDFLFYFLRHPATRTSAVAMFTGSSGRQRVPPEFWSQFELPLPPLPVQAAIVSILQKADSIRRKRAQARQLASLLQSSLFKKMFSRGADKCPLQPLESLLTERPRYGSSLLANSLGQGTPVLRIPNVLSGELDLTDIKYIQDLPAKPCETLSVRSGDILVVRSNGNRAYVGRCAVVPELERSFIYASYLIRLRPDLSKVHPLFLDAFLKTEEARNQMLRGIPTSAGNYNINSTTLSNLQVPIPRLDAQQRFAYVASQINAASSRLTASEALTDACWHVLLERAFTGDLVA